MGYVMGGSLSKVIKQIRVTIRCSQLGLREAIFDRDEFCIGPRLRSGHDVARIYFFIPLFVIRCVVRCVIWEE